MFVYPFHCPQPLRSHPAVDENHMESQDVKAFFFSLFLSTARKLRRMQEGLVPFGWNFTAARETMVRHSMEQPRMRMSGVSGVLTKLTSFLHSWRGFCERALPKLLRGVTLIILHYLALLDDAMFRKLSFINHSLFDHRLVILIASPRRDLTSLMNDILETHESLLRRILFTSDPLGRYLDSYGIGTVGCAFTSAHKIRSDRSINPS